MPVTTTVYNSKDKIISKVKNNYEFIPLKTVNFPVSNDIFDPLFGAMQANTAGWARIKSTESTINGIKQTKAFTYARQGVATPDLVVGSESNIKIINNFSSTFASSFKNMSNNQTTCIKSYICDNWGKDRSLGRDGKNDLVLISTASDPLFCDALKMWIWIDYEDNDNGDIYSCTYCNGGIDFCGAHADYVLGMKLLDLDANGQKNDLLYIYLDENDLYIKSTVLHNLTPEQGLSISWTDGNAGAISHTRSLFQCPYRDHLSLRRIVSCGIDDLDGNGIQDLIFIAGNKFQVHDNTPTKMFVYKDWTEAAPIKTPLTTVNEWSIYGKNITCGQYVDEGTVKHDIIISGLDNNDKIQKSIFKDVTINGSNVVIGGTGELEAQTSPFSCLSSIPGEHWYCGMDSSIVDKKGIYVFATTESRLAIIDFNGDAVANGDLDGQPNEVWTTAPKNKCIVTKTIPAYWMYGQMGVPTAAQPNNKRMLTQPCQTIVYAGPEATGTILRERWFDISGTSINDIRSKLSSIPDETTEITSFDCPVDLENKDHYGQRVSGYITAPETGNYTFWIASDDNSELWLSTDENPSNVRKIAYVIGWTGQHEWTKFPSQQSLPVALVTGKRYYIQALHIDNDQTDYLAVGWQGPGMTIDQERPIPGRRLTPMPTPKNVVSSQATTWSSSTGTWLPSANYSWKSDMNSSGLATTPLADFNFSNPSARDASWKYTGSIEKYDHFSTPLETKNGKGISSSAIYRNDKHLPIASIANASFYECGVFTCDYNMNEPESGYNSYFDKANGWEKGQQAVLTNDPVHFGESSVKILNGEGIMRNFKIQPNKKYVVSAWVNVTDGTLPLVVEYWTRDDATIPHWPMKWTDLTRGKVTQVTQGTTNGLWKLMKAEIPAETDPNLWIRITVGSVNVTSVTAYVDDVRFYPANSLVSSTYYDSKLSQPILTIDANNNPSQKVVYDEFGRPVRWYKIDKTDPSNTSKTVLLQQKEYHMQNELLPGEDLRITSPTDNEDIYAGEETHVYLTRGIAQSNCLEYKRTADATWTQIYCDPNGTSNPIGCGEIAWTVPSALAGSEIQLRASDANGSRISIISGINVVNR